MEYSWKTRINCESFLCDSPSNSHGSMYVMGEALPQLLRTDYNGAVA